MSSTFSDYVRRLEPGAELPDAEAYEALLETLRGALVHEMRKRTLWSAPPSYLGVFGAASWDEGDLLEDLLLDCYLFIFIHRLPGLRAQALVRENVDGLVFLDIRHFLHERQKRHDPLGFRVFKVLHTAVGLALGAGWLHVLGGDPKVRNDTVLGFASRGVPGNVFKDGVFEDGVPEDFLDLGPRAAVWNDELMPDLVTAWSIDGVVGELASRLAQLPGEGIDVFRFRDLVEPMKGDVRARWHAIRVSAGGETAVEEGEDLARIVPLVRPDRAVEERQSFRRLVDCMTESLGRLGESEKTRDYLVRLWLFLRGWAAELTDEEAGYSGERPPSDKKLGELLGIPRGRIPGLKATLGGMVETCRQGAARKRKQGNSGKKAVTRKEEKKHGAAPGAWPGRLAPSYGGKDGYPVTDVQRRRERLRELTGEALARLAEDRTAVRGLEGTAPAPGGTFVFAATRAFPVEWLVVAEEADGAGRFLVVPVDDHPLLGSRDVEVRHGAEGDVGRVRCGHAVLVGAGAFDAARRTGVVGPEVVERVRRRRAQIEAGSLEASHVSQETDSDPEYGSWVEMLDEAGTVLAEPAKVLRPTFSHRAPRWTASRLYGLAASVVLAVALVGLLQQGSDLRDLEQDRQTLDESRRRLEARTAEQARRLREQRLRIEELDEQRARETQKIADLERDLEEVRSRPDTPPAPYVNLPFLQMNRAETVRGGGEPFRVPADARRIALVFEVVDPADYSSYRLRVLERYTQREVWSSDGLVRMPPSWVSLDLPLPMFETGDYLVRIYGLKAGEAKFLEEYPLRLELVP